MISDSPPYADLALRIVRTRTDLNLSQIALARQLEVKQQSVSRWETGTHRPAVGQIAQLAAALDLDPQELMRLAAYAPPTATPLTQPLPLDGLSPENFERFVADLLRAQHPDASVRLQGARGHDQGGFDIIAQFNNGEIWGVQCKREQRFGPANVRRAIAAADAKTDRNILALSRVASPQAAEEIRAHPQWRLWDQEDLSRELRLLPGDIQDRLVDIHFGGQRLALLGRAEPGPWATAERYFAPFATRSGIFSHDWALIGRDAELAQLVIAMANTNATVSLLVAPGGMGKSRLLKEATTKFAEQNPTVRLLFLATASDPTRANLNRLGSGRKVLIVDDAHDRDALGVLFDYVADSSNNTTLVIATRPYAESRIRNDAAAFGLAPTETVTLAPLKSAALTDLVKQVLREFGGEEHWAEDIVEAVSDNPLVAVMAARIVARDGAPTELARSETGLRGFILARFTRIVTGQIGQAADEPLLRDLLELLALIQPFHIDDRRLAELAEKTKGLNPDAITRLLRLLIDGGIIYRRGHLYRLMPDLLGDHLIEQSCVGIDGKLTRFAERVIDEIDPAQLTQVLVNLGRLDWRREGGDPSKSRLLDGVWWTLRDIENEWDQRLNAVRAVAIYQPSQALRFVQSQINANRPHHALSGILRAVAFVPEYRREACMLLWQLGRDDQNETGSNPGHPLRVLAELADYTEHKPLDFIEDIVSFAMELSRDDLAWGGRFSPLDILAPVLSGQGMNTRSSSRAVTLTPFFVDYDVVKSLRQRVIDRMLELTGHPDPAIAHRAAAFLENALRPPMGLLGASPDDDLRMLYNAEFVETLSSVRRLVEGGNLAPATLIAIAHAVEWHARYGAGATNAAALATLHALPANLAFRMRAALIDGMGHSYRGQTAFDEWADDSEKVWLPALAQELKTAAPDLDALCHDVLAAIAELAAAGENIDGAFSLVGELLAGDTAMARAFIDRAHADARARGFLGAAIRQWLETSPDEGRRMVRGALADPDPEIAAGGVSAFVALKRELEPRDLDILKDALQSDEAWVVFAALRAVWLRRDLAEETALDLVLLAPFERHPKLFPDVAMMLREGRRSLAPALDSARAKALLARMQALPRIEGHWAEELLRALANSHPHLLVDFLLARLETADEVDDGVRFSRHRAHLGLHQSQHAADILQRLWSWLEGHAYAAPYFRYRAAELFAALFQPDSAVVIAFFDQKLDGAGTDQLRLIAGLLREAHHSFVFKQAVLVERLLERCRQVGGEELLTNAIQQLSSSAMSGVRSGHPGEPMPRDLEAKRQAEAILARLSRLSAAYPLYELILRRADADITQSIQEGVLMDQADEE